MYMDVEGLLHGLFGRPMDSFLWKYLNGHVCSVPSRTIENIVARHRSALTAVDANMLRHVQENAVLHTPFCFVIDGGHFEDHCNYDTCIV
jgi:hypothetical protein